MRTWADSGSMSGASRKLARSSTGKLRAWACLAALSSTWLRSPSMCTKVSIASSWSVMVMVLLLRRSSALRQAQHADLQVAVVGLGGERGVLRRQAALLDDRRAAAGGAQALVGEPGQRAELVGVRGEPEQTVGGDHRRGLCDQIGVVAIEGPRRAARGRERRRVDQHGVVALLVA